MKKLEEMTEQEIYNLSEEEIEKMKRLALAEAGIKIMNKPKTPKLFEIDEKDAILYVIPLISDEYGFTDMQEAAELLEFLKKSKSFGYLDYNSNAGYEMNYIVQEKKRKYSSSKDCLKIESKPAYSTELFQKIVDSLTANKRMQEQSEKDIKEYNAVMEEAAGITSEITNKILEIRQKYDRLKNLHDKFINDYLPLADNDRDIAMKFMKKAYSLNGEEVEYILDN
ncbi:MAG: hypothetical protein LBE91_19010 [Tannerella sp.]|jgi:hypothetical protein|nr:hypothetical protein [Tannerella sp.]